MTGGWGTKTPEPTEEEWEAKGWELHPDKASVIEISFYRMTPGSILFLCTYGDTGCPHEEDPNCPNCRQIEKQAGDTLEVFAARCEQSN